MNINLQSILKKAVCSVGKRWKSWVENAPSFLKHTEKIDEKRLKIIDVQFLKIIFSFFTHSSFAVKFLPFSISELAAIIKSFFCATSCTAHRMNFQFNSEKWWWFNSPSYQFLWRWGLAWERGRDLYKARNSQKKLSNKYRLWPRL